MTLLLKQRPRDLDDDVELSNRVTVAGFLKAEPVLVRDGFKRLAGIIGDIHELMAR